VSVLIDILAGWGALSLAAGTAVVVWVQLTARAINREHRASWDESLERMLQEGDRP
jgi:hypothetical protein